MTKSGRGLEGFRRVKERDRRRKWLWPMEGARPGKAGGRGLAEAVLFGRQSAICFLFLSVFLPLVKRRLS